MNLKLFWGFAVASCCGINTAKAAEPPQNDIFQLSLEELLKVKVTSASRRQESAIDAPATLRVINRRQINERGYQNLSEILQDTIGIDHAWAADSPDFNRVNIRGVFGNNKLIILQDGIRISPSNGDVVAIAENFPLYAVAQVEILFGPASALYGADAMTAVINLITIKSDQEISEFGGSFGDNNNERAHLLHQWTAGKFNFRLSGHRQQTDYSKLANDFPQAYQLGDLVDFANNVIVDAAQRVGPQFKNSSHSLDLRMSYDTHWVAGYTARDFRYPTSTASLPSRVDYGSKPVWQADLKTWYLNYQNHISDHLSTEITLTHNLYELDTDTSFANIFVGYQRNYKYARSEKSDWSQLFKYSMKNGQFLTAGYSLEWFSSIPITADLPTAYKSNLGYQQQSQFFPGTDNQIQIPIFKVDWRNYALFAQLQSQWSNKLTSSIGVRYDESTTYGGSVNPRLGLVYQRTPESSFKLSYAEAFLAPSPQNTYRFFGSFAFQQADGLYHSFFFQLPNEDLKPESLKTFEMSWTELLNEHWSIESSLYTNHLENLIQAVTTNEPINDFIEGGFIETTQINDNVATLNSYGLDLTVNFQIEFNANNALHAWLNYSYVDGDKKTDFGKTSLPFTSPNKVRSGLTWNWQNWNISPVVRWTDRSTLSEVGIAEGLTSDSYAVTDLFIQRKDLLPALNVFVDINNLFDTAYRAPGEGSSTVFEEVPQLKRWIVLGFTYRF